MTEFARGMFGYVPAWLPDRIGRTVMLAALVEVKVDAIVMNLSGRPQPTYAGGNIEANLDRARTLVRQRLRDPAQEAVIDLLDQVGSALRKRNAIVHSVWPDNSEERARGWRNLPKSQRQLEAEGETWSGWTELGESDFEELQTELQELVDRLVDAVAATGAIGAG